MAQRAYALSLLELPLVTAAGAQPPRCAGAGADDPEGNKGDIGKRDMENKKGNTRKHRENLSRLECCVMSQGTLASLHLEESGGFQAR